MKCSRALQSQQPALGFDTSELVSEVKGLWAQLLLLGTCHSSLSCPAPHCSWLQKAQGFSLSCCPSASEGRALSFQTLQKGNLESAGQSHKQPVCNQRIKIADWLKSRDAKYLPSEHKAGAVPPAWKTLCESAF